jgi:hypothetical protein
VKSVKSRIVLPPFLLYCKVRGAFFVKTSLPNLHELPVLRRQICTGIREKVFAQNEGAFTRWNA